jgi:hypothetical protein
MKDDHDYWVLVAVRYCVEDMIRTMQWKNDIYKRAAMDKGVLELKAILDEEVKVKS